MPFYEYECPHCGHREEVLQQISDKPLKKCPNCGKSGLKKLMSAPVFRLKGSGWYETDFKSDKDKQRNLAGPDKEEAKSEAAPAAKSDAKPDAAKAEAPKTESAKGESAKPAPAQKETTAASKSARKAAAPRAKSKAKPVRAAQRTRR
jgi:putative FmdB family regulatory protein